MGSLVAFYVFLGPLLVLVLIGYYKLFEKAGQPGWYAIIPFYGAYIQLRIIGKPWWWLLLLFIPVVDVFIGVAMIVELVKCFGRFKFWQHVLAVSVGFLYLPYLGFSKSVKYLGINPTQPKKIKKSATREWIDAIVFAVIAATLIRGLVVEAYTIPTSSMEKSLLVGDFLFVNKMSYGPRMPITPLSFPFVHNTMPLIGTKSYLEWIKLPYYRLPGFSHIKNNDVVVFNYPLDSTRPVDEQENYIKRCIGIPGDTIELRDAQVYVNGKAAWNPPNMQGEYYVKTDGSPINPETLQDMNITENGAMVGSSTFSYFLTKSGVEKMKSLKNVVSVTPHVLAKGAPNPEGFDPIFPDDYANFPFNVDNYGPIIIPKKGVTVKITPENIALYKRIIRVYEGNADEDSIGVKDNKVYFNGKELTQYTFKMNYYWMMGDNRHNSEDSRYWGFVPEDHVVGKAWFIWMSWDSNADFPNEIRWSRLFHFIH